MSEKVVGYILLTAGIIIIILSSLSVYYVFKEKAKPFDIFKLPGISIDLSNLAAGEIPGNASADLKTELVDAEIINKPMNLVAHVLLMGFMVNVGFKIATLGVQMVRPIKVNLKEEGDKNGL